MHHGNSCMYSTRQATKEAWQTSEALRLMEDAHFSNCIHSGHTHGRICRDDQFDGIDWIAVAVAPG